MRFIITILVLFALQAYGQTEALAKQYFDKGEFEKAQLSYQKLYAQNPRNFSYLERLVQCHQQLQAYDQAEALLAIKLQTKVYPPQLWVLRGYNFQLQDDLATAEKNYKEAIGLLDINPNLGGLIGNTFQRYSLLDWALKTYDYAMKLNPSLNYNIQIARIYGEKGDVEQMFDSYLNLLRTNLAYTATVQRNLGQFISDDPDDENNTLLRKTILKKLQEDANPIYNEMLSWLFAQQKQYRQAFMQERALFNRSQAPSLQPFQELARIAKEEQDPIALTILDFVIEQAQDPETKLWGYQNKLELQIDNLEARQIKEIDEEFQRLFTTYGLGEQTAGLQIMYAKFLAFTKNEVNQSISQLKDLLNNPMSRFQKAQAKMALADILVFDEKFNQALIYYSQIQKDLKNDVIGQQARFKVAQTSYFKGDFKWAETQLKVLKSSTSQLIANDALQLKLLISDNAFQDSTLTALKTYAKADLLAFQRKHTQAIILLEDILQNHKGEAIEDEALLKQAALHAKVGAFDKARFNYKKIIEFYGTGFLADDAHFELAKLYEEVFDEPDLAQQHYERIIFDFPDSIFFVESRGRYRSLRGDQVNP